MDKSLRLLVVNMLWRGHGSGSTCWRLHGIHTGVSVVKGWRSWVYPVLSSPSMWGTICQYLLWLRGGQNRIYHDWIRCYLLMLCLHLVSIMKAIHNNWGGSEVLWIQTLLLLRLRFPMLLEHANAVHHWPTVKELVLTGSWLGGGRRGDHWQVLEACARV